MNRHHNATILAGLVTVAGLGAATRADVPLVRDGKPVAKIYFAPAPAGVPGSVDPSIANAVRELNYHLQKMSGTALETVETADAAAVKGPAIVLGDLAVKMGATPQKTVDSGEGFRIIAKGNTVLIGGQTERAALLGAYTLLGKLGCDWVMPGEIGEIIPQRVTVEVKNVDESQAPDFVMRRLWYRGYGNKDWPAQAGEGERFGQWLARQRAGSYSPPSNGVGGHMWDQFIGRHADEFTKDPTMYALRRGADGTVKRGGPQLESTHPRVIELMVQDIKDAFEKNKWPKDKAVGFPIGPADGLGYSISAETVAAGAGRIDPIVGELDRTDELVLLSNTVLEKLGPEYPNVSVGFYSYSTHADYPMRYKPHPHIAVIFAPINFSRFHSLTDTNSKSQAYYKDVVEQWGRLAKQQGNPLIYRGYNWNLAENMLPYSKIRIWGEELPFYKKMGFLGHNVEATKAWSVNGPSDYVFMKMAWDSTQNWKAVLHEYCVKSFGAGAPSMERYLLRLTQTQHGAGQEAGSYSAFPLIYDNAFVAAAEKDIAEAAALAQDPAQDIRIGHFEGNVAALKLYLAYFKATTDFDFPAAKAGYDAMLALWQKTHAANSDLVANETPQYLKRFIATFVDGSLKYTTGDYKMIGRIPDELPTLLDPNTVGHRMQFFSPTLQETNLIKTKTFSSTWDAQGLVGLRSGAVWYRHHFKLTPAEKGKPIGLFLGGFEDEARVWINGRLIGTSGQQFSAPAAFDLTEGVNYTGDNVLAIEVVRNSFANEIGLGGLLRPSFLFTGPRLEKAAPATLQLRRILPGGEMGEIEK